MLIYWPVLAVYVLSVNFDKLGSPCTMANGGSGWAFNFSKYFGWIALLSPFWLVFAIAPFVILSIVTGPPGWIWRRS
jgi:hypothetical protein